MKKYIKEKINKLDKEISKISFKKNITFLLGLVVAGIFSALTISFFPVPILAIITTFIGTNLLQVVMFNNLSNNLILKKLKKQKEYILNSKNNDNSEEKIQIKKIELLKLQKKLKEISDNASENISFKAVFCCLSLFLPFGIIFFPTEFCIITIIGLLGNTVNFLNLINKEKNILELETKINNLKDDIVKNIYNFRNSKQNNSQNISFNYKTSTIKTDSKTNQAKTSENTSHVKANHLKSSKVKEQTTNQNSVFKNNTNSTLNSLNNINLNKNKNKNISISKKGNIKDFTPDFYLEFIKQLPRKEDKNKVYRKK